MVVWVYAGGGDAEAEGILPFLRKNLLHCSFELRSPKPKPGPRPGKVIYSGHTGRSLISEIRSDIQDYWDATAEVIVVIDDTDDTDALDEREQSIRNVIFDSVRSKARNPAGKPAPIVIVGLAVPEIEIWLLADWNNTFAQRFKLCEWAVKRELVNRGVDFERPESFDVRDERGVYANKISEIIKEVILLTCQDRISGRGMPYSKATDTPDLLRLIDPTVVSGKCPYFRNFWTGISPLCATSKGARA